MANILKPEDLAVVREKKRHKEAVVVKEIGCGSPGVALSMGKNILGAKGYFFRFDDTKNPSNNTESIVSRPMVLIFFDG